MEKMSRHLHGPIDVPELHQVREELHVHWKEVGYLQDILVVHWAVQRCNILLLMAQALYQSASKRVISQILVLEGFWRT